MNESLRYSSLSLVLALAIGCGGERGAPPAQEGQPPAAPAETAAPALSVDLPAGVTAEMVARGAEVFAGAGICYTCHMAGGVGGPLGPNLTDGEWLQIDGSYEAIVGIVTTGVPQPSQYPGIMLPRGGTNISNDDVRAVSAYVWTLSHGG